MTFCAGLFYDCVRSRGPWQEVTFVVQDDKPVGPDGVQLKFDDERVVSDAGVMLVATVAQRLGVEALAHQLVRLRRDRPGAANAGRKVMLAQGGGEVLLAEASIDEEFRLGLVGWHRQGLSDARARARPEEGVRPRRLG